MGYLTTFTIHNDALGAFEKNPKGFAEALFKGMQQASMEHKAVSVPFDSYANYITVEPSRHADDHTIFVHRGNTVVNLNPWNEDFKELVARNPEVALDYIKTAELLIKEAKLKAKENLKKSKPSW